MGGIPDRQLSMLSSLSTEDLIPVDHPIRKIRVVVDAVLADLDGDFDEMYASSGRRSVPPEQLLKATVLMAMYSMRSERAFCERLNYDMLFKWFLDLAIDAKAFDATTFTKNRQRLLDHDIADKFFAAVVRARRSCVVGLGVALAQTDRRVIVITGDGEQLMALGSLATIVVAAPANLDIYVLDNEHYGETGMQASHTGHGIDLAATAAAAGFVDTATVSNLDDLDALTARTASEPAAGPRLYVLKIAVAAPPRSLPPRNAVFIKNRFRAHLGHAPN